MKNITSHTGILTIVTRLPNSVNGNPRYLIDIGNVTCRTAVDSMHGYAVSNYDGRPVKATIGMHYGHATLESIKPVV